MEKKPSFPVDLRGDKKMYPLSASDYKLLEEIGKGVSAVVYRAICLPYEEFVAIKTLDLERCNSSLDDIRREAQTMSLINHPNVMKAHCSFVVNHALWVVMPFMAGGSCLHIMKAAFPDGFEEPVIASFLKETLKALEYLHHQGHIHRDVKAGNILVDANGVIKLGDFGVSACMFDAGDRQRSRSTFVGTPCWMAPEVMEQVHGYDFKADIWSFGITALELAHGHAPFSKYPPMKVLLMTLQNAPPGLDYERDKRFSKSFKEMVAMCLVKDPSKRPSAEKLLKHSFFKHARSSEYIGRTILDPLPPLWERVRDVKMRDEARLAEKKMPYVEQEARSQNEYKRGVSSWNFDLEDLKAQAALNDGEPLAGKDFHSMESSRKDNDLAELNRATSPPPPSPMRLAHDQSGNDVGEHVMKVRTAVPSKHTNDSKPPTGKKEPKHFGRFDVFDDDPEQDISDACQDNGDLKHQRSNESKNVSVKPDDQKNGREINGKEHNLGIKEFEEAMTDHEHLNQRLSSNSVSENLDDVHEDRAIQSIGKMQEDDGSVPHPSKPKSPGAPPLPPSNGIPVPSRLTSEYKAQKEPPEDKVKGQAVFQKKGRFSVTSQDEDIQEAPNSRKNSNVQAPSSSQTPAVSTVSAAVVMPQLQTLLSQTAAQQELIVTMMNSINPSEHNSHKLSAASSRNSSRSTMDSMGDLVTERERDLLSQVAELQCRVTGLVEELQSLKLRNVQLERQLNAIFNKEEEERIRKEEAARDDG